MRISESEESKEGKEAAKAAWAKQVITEGFNGLEAILADTAGVYAVGDEVTLADAYIVPQMFNAVRFGVDIEKFPIISRVAAAAKALPAFAAADPDSQPDKPAA